MRFADFSDAKMQEMLTEWGVICFIPSSGRCPAGRCLLARSCTRDVKSHRDGFAHPQTSEQQAEKSKGRAFALPGAYLGAKISRPREFHVPYPLLDQRIYFGKYYFGFLVSFISSVRGQRVSKCIRQDAEMTRY